MKGSPQVRRKFIDMELGQVSPIYLYDLVQYQSVLKQRNQYLKQLAEKKQTDTVYLDILTEQLAEFGGKVLYARLGFLKKLEHWANLLHQKLVMDAKRSPLTTHQASQLTTRIFP